MIPADWLEQAAARYADASAALNLQPTPLTFDAEHNLYLKWENHQVTGSFKIRGALNKVLSLQPWEQQRGLVAASAGNHGQGVAVAARLVGTRALIFASEHAVPAKVEKMRALGADVRLVAGGYHEAELAGLAEAQAGGGTWVSPYNDPQVICGQATLALETLCQLPDTASFTWIVPVGGGGLLSGIGLALQQNGAAGFRLVGVQSEASPFFQHLIDYGSQDQAVELDSLADGLSGSVEAGALTVPLARRVVTRMVLVSEAQIARAIAFAWYRYGESIEGSAAAALAAALNGQAAERPAVVVITGGNIQPQVHAEVCARHRQEFGAQGQA